MDPEYSNPVSCRAFRAPSRPAAVAISSHRNGAPRAKVLKRICLAALLLFGPPLHHAGAQTPVIERDVKATAGRDSRVAIYTSIRPDCTSGPLPAIRLAAAPAHGTVSVRRGTLKATNVKQCLAIEVPALIAFYRSVRDFTGADEFQLEITLAGGRKEIQDFRVTVMTNPAGGEGI